MSKKIRVNTTNSKVLNGKLFISLLKAQQITSKVLKELINMRDEQIIGLN